MRWTWLVVMVAGLLVSAECRAQEAGASSDEAAAQEPAPQPGSGSSARWLAGADSPWAKRPWTVEANASLWGSPTGQIGVGAEFAPLPWASIGAGVGVSLFGPQYGAMARVRPVSFRASTGESIAPYVGLGVSGGKYKVGTDCRSSCPGFLSPGDGQALRVWDHAFWGNLELGVEVRLLTGVSFRGFAGYERNLRPSAGQCVHEKNGAAPVRSECNPSSQQFGLGMVYAGAALGYSFGL